MQEVSECILITGHQPIFCEGLSSIANRLYPGSDIKLGTGLNPGAISSGNDFSLVLADIGNPSSSSVVDALTELASRTGAAIVVFSDRVSPGFVREVMELGIAGFIPKTLALNLPRARFGSRAWRPLRARYSADAQAEASAESILRAASHQNSRRASAMYCKRLARADQIRNANQAFHATVKLRKNAILQALGVRNRTEGNHCARAQEAQSGEEDPPDRVVCPAGASRPRRLAGVLFTSFVRRCSLFASIQNWGPPATKRCPLGPTSDCTPSRREVSPGRGGWRHWCWMMQEVRLKRIRRQLPLGETVSRQAARRRGKARLEVSPMENRQLRYGGARDRHVLAHDSKQAGQHVASAWLLVTASRVSTPSRTIAPAQQNFTIRAAVPQRAASGRTLMHTRSAGADDLNRLLGRFEIEGVVQSAALVRGKLFLNFDRIIA